MPTVETIEAFDASALPYKMSKVATQLVYGMNSLTNDVGLTLAPDDGTSLRERNTGVARSASNNSLKVKSSDDGTVLCVRRAVALDLLAGADRVVDRVRHPLNHPRHGA